MYTSCQVSHWTALRAYARIIQVFCVCHVHDIYRTCLYALPSRAAVLAVYAAEALLLAFALKLKVAAAGREAGGGRTVRTGLGTAGYSSAIATVVAACSTS
jgi:hypothetical protein